MKKILATMLSLATFSIISNTHATGLLEDKIIILDPGHGTGYNSYADYNEGDYMFYFYQQMAPLLEAEGATVYTTRTDGTNVSLQERAAYFNKVGLEIVKNEKEIDLLYATPLLQEKINEEIEEIDRLIGLMQLILDDYQTYAPIYLNTPYSRNREIHPDLERIFEIQNTADITSSVLMISLHSNATGTPINESINGVIAFYPSNTYDEVGEYYDKFTNVEQSKYFCEIITDNLGELGFATFNEKESNFFVIREHNLPGVLVENGFHTNAQDREKLMDEQFRQQMAEVYLDTIITYFNSDYVPEKLENLIFTKENLENTKVISQMNEIMNNPAYTAVEANTLLKTMLFPLEILVQGICE